MRMPPREGLGIRDDDMDIKEHKRRLKEAEREMIARHSREVEVARLRRLRQEADMRKERAFKRELEQKKTNCGIKAQQSHLRWQRTNEALKVTTELTLSEDGLELKLDGSFVAQSIKKAVQIKMQIEEAAMREALIELGWTPPEQNPHTVSGPKA
jgi:hypothetical protein